MASGGAICLLLAVVVNTLASVENPPDPDGSMLLADEVPETFSAK